MAPLHEGDPADQARTVILPADQVLRALGQIPGGLQNVDNVRLAALAHGIELGPEDGAEADTASYPRTPDSHPYPSGTGPVAAGADRVHYVDDGQAGAAADSQPRTVFRDVRRRGQPAPGQQDDQPGWPVNGWAAEAALGSGSRPGGVRGQHGAVPALPLGAPVAATGTEPDPWTQPVGSVPGGRGTADATSPNLLPPGDLARLQGQGQGHREKSGGFNLRARTVAILSAAALAATLSGGAVYLNHKNHVDFNNNARATVDAPAFIPQGTVARTLLETDTAAIQDALVDPAISASQSNDMLHNMVYNRQLGALYMAILLQVGGGDPNTAGDPGVVWPLTTKAYGTDYGILVANEKARGEPVSPDNANNLETDARVVGIDMNRFFAGHYQPGDRPSIADLARAYAIYEAQQLGAPNQKAADAFGASIANLVAQSGLTEAQYAALKATSKQYAALGKDQAWIAHIGRLGNKGTQGS